MERASDGRAVGSRMGDYVWDGRQWVPSQDGAGNTFDGSRWNRPPDPRLNMLPPGLTGPAFADPRYAYGLTKQTSDDLQFIARYVKIVIIVVLVLVGIGLIVNLFFLGSIAALLSQLVGGLPR
ncbi:MAG: hypothetical protein QM804_10765 [Propionicimonas sp.]